RFLQNGGAGRVPVRDQHGQPLKQEIGCPKWFIGARGRACRPRDLLRARLHSKPAGKQGSNKRIEIGLTSKLQVNSLEPRGRPEHERWGVVPSIAREGDSTTKNVQ